MGSSECFVGLPTPGNSVWQKYEVTKIIHVALKTFKGFLEIRQGYWNVQLDK